MYHVLLLSLVGLLAVLARHSDASQLAQWANPLIKTVTVLKRGIG